MYNNRTLKWIGKQVYTNSFSIKEFTITKLQEDQCYMCTVWWKNIDIIKSKVIFL